MPSATLHGDKQFLGGYKSRNNLYIILFQVREGRPEYCCPRSGGYCTIPQNIIRAPFFGGSEYTMGDNKAETISQGGERRLHES